MTPLLLALPLPQPVPQEVHQAHLAPPPATTAARLRRTR